MNIFDQALVSSKNISESIIKPSRYFWGNLKESFAVRADSFAFYDWILLFCEMIVLRMDFTRGTLLTWF